MDEETIQKLFSKGWSEEEIKKAQKILSEQKPSKGAFFIAMLYWLFLFLAIGANLVVSAVLFPLLIISRSNVLYLLIIFLGVVFGLLFSFILKELEAIQSQDHIIAGVFIPAIALINMAYMTGVANRVSSALQISVQQSPILIALAYCLSFVAAFFMANYLTKYFSKITA